MKTRKKGRPVAVDSNGASSRVRMILVAEKLFAEKGLDGVSLREIMLVARQGNSNAIQYHFGSKEGLVLAIFGFRVTEMEGVRRRMLDGAGRSGRLTDIRTLFNILFRPYLDLVDDEGRHSYAAFMAAYLVRYRPLGMKHAGDTPEVYSHALSETVQLIYKCAKGIPLKISQNRLEIVNLMFFNVVCRWDNSLAESADRLPLEMLVDDVLNIISTAFLLPPPKSGRQRYPDSRLDAKRASARD